MTAAPRLVLPDAGRGLAALAVFVSHAGLGLALSRATGIAAFRWLDLPGHTIAVPFFFVLSGFAIHHAELQRRGAAGPASPLDLRIYFLRRFFRLYPPYLSALVLSLLALHWAGDPPPPSLWPNLTLTQAFSDSTFNAINPVFWSVGIEACLYALYPLWWGWRRRWGLRSAMIFGGAVTLASLILFAQRANPERVSRLWFFTNLWFAWLLGSLAAERENQPSRPEAGGDGRLGAFGRMAAFGLLSAALAALLPRWVEVSSSLWFRLWSAFLLGFGLLALLLIAEERRRRLPPALWAGWIRPAAWLGGCSYSLYLLHFPLLALLRSGLSQVAGAQLLRAPIFAAGLVLIVLACSLHARWVEFPSIAWGRRLASRRSS